NVLVHAATNQNGLYDQAGQSVAASKGKPLAAA
ncbi:MAG: flagellar biosynthesis protein FlgN, partial [Hydrogenophilales bacterium 12-64-6]